VGEIQLGLSMDFSWIQQNQMGTWLVALAVFAGAVLVLVLARHLATRRARGGRGAPATTVSDLVASLLAGTGFIFLLVVALALASLVLALPDDIRRIVRVLAVLALLVQLGIWGNGAISLWVRRTSARSPDAGTLTLVHALSGVGRLILVVVLLLLALDNFGVNTTALIAGLGISGLALALAVQSTLQDLFATLSIILDKPFVVGDLIELDAFAGRVEHIGIKTTRLRSVSGEQIIIGNGDLMRGRIRNHRRTTERRGTLAVRVAPDTPRDALPKITAAIGVAASGTSGVRLDHVALREVSPNGPEFETVYYSTDGTPAGTARARERLALGIAEALEAEGYRVTAQMVVLRPGLG
jgi:small-conductance mechanosensitive channel